MEYCPPVFSLGVKGIPDIILTLSFYDEFYYINYFQNANMFSSHFLLIDNNMFLIYFYISLTVISVKFEILCQGYT